MKQSEKYGFPIYEDEDNVELDKYTEELTEKLEDLEDTDREEINNIYKDIQASKIHYKTEQAKSLYIDDATDSRGKIEVFGNVEQETREGYNLYDKSKEIVGEAINATGGIQKIPNWSRSDFIPIESNKEISMTCENKVNGQFAIIEYDSNKTFIKVNAYDFRNSAADNKYTITTTNTTAYVIGQYRNDLNMTNIMIIYGAQNKAYEEYGASPSVGYPSKVKCLGSNKNLFNINGTRAEQSTGECSYSDGKITITKVGPIRIIVDGLKIGKSYILSWGNGNINSVQTVYTSSNTDIDRNYNMNSSTKFIASESTVTVCILNTEVGQYIENLKLEEGETATTYSPYRTR